MNKQFGVPIKGKGAEEPERALESLFGADNRPCLARVVKYGVFEVISIILCFLSARTGAACVLDGRLMLDGVINFLGAAMFFMLAFILNEQMRDLT